MRHFIFFALRRQRGRNIAASSGFLLATCALILLSATTQTTVLQANQIISQNWRSTYDLVVLPSQEPVSAMKTVPADLFEGYDGGISIQQYEQIKKLPGVAVAAPIAYIGYALLPGSSVQLGPVPPTPGFYDLTWTLTAFNGKQHLIEYQSLLRSYVQPSSESLDSKTLDAFNTLGIENIQAANFFGKNEGYEISLPVVGTFLLAAIDPAAEDQLVHLNSGIVSGTMLPEQQPLQLDTQDPQLAVGGSPGQNHSIPNYDIPLLFNAQPSGNITLHATLIRVKSDTLNPQQILARGGLSYLEHLPRQTVFAGNVPFALNTPQFFSPGLTLAQDGHTWQLQQSKFTGSGTMPEQPVLTFVSAPSGLTYRPATPPNGGIAPAYTLVPAANQNTSNIATQTNMNLQNTESNLQGNMATASPEVAFRTLTPLQGQSYYSGAYTAYNGAIYTPQTIGVFNDQRLAAEFTNPLNWLPENTYAAPPVVLRYDAHGHAVTPTNLLPTTNPAGFTLQPPLALTTLAAAERIRGVHCISVIRVRVAGNVSPDEVGWLHVTHVAQLIHQQTGLQVLITPGSSPKPTLVYIPGIRQGEDGATQSIAPLGWAEERWIAIGAGIIYLQQSGETRSLLLGAILLVCLGYLIVTLSALVSAQRRELAVLSALGWEPWQAAASFLSQAFLLALGGGIVGLALALLIVFLIGASPPWLLVAWTIPIVLGLAILAALYLSLIHI